MSEEADFVVTIHALERMDERFPDLTSGKTDREVGELIHNEVMDALDAGRRSKMPPIQLAPEGRERWLAAKKHGSVTWTQNKERGYILQDTDEGLLVLTVLVGKEQTWRDRMLLKNA
jgi:hypothetical protein